MKKKYYNGHNQRKKNKNIVLVFPRSLLVHHRLSSMIIKSMIFLFLTWHNYIFHIYTFLTYLTYRIFPFVSSCLLYLNAYLGDYIDWRQQLEKKSTLLFCNPSIRPENQQQIWSHSTMDTWHILHAYERVQQCKYLTNTMLQQICRE